MQKFTISQKANSRNPEEEKEERLWETEKSMTPYKKKTDIIN